MTILRRFGLAGPLVVLWAAFAILAAGGAGGIYSLYAQDPEPESTPACDAHNHSGITQDCANVANHNGDDEWWGSATTTMSQTVDEVSAWSRGIEACWLPFGLIQWEERVDLEDRWIAGANGEGDLRALCAPWSYLTHHSWHPAEHEDINFDWHPASTSLAHPNAWFGD